MNKGNIFGVIIVLVVLGIGVSTMMFTETLLEGQKEYKIYEEYARDVIIEEYGYEIVKQITNFSFEGEFYSFTFIVNTCSTCPSSVSIREITLMVNYQTEEWYEVI